MHTTTETIASRLADAFTETDTADARRWSWQPLLHLLARGEPVTADDLAAAAGRPVDRVRAVLPTLPGIERDRQGRVVGAGITLRPTPYWFEVDGRHLYTWCALDTLIFPAILGRTARVVSPCHTTGTPIRRTVEPDRLDASTGPPRWCRSSPRTTCPTCGRPSATRSTSSAPRGPHGRGLLSTPPPPSSRSARRSTSAGASPRRSSPGEGDACR